MVVFETEISNEHLGKIRNHLNKGEYQSYGTRYTSGVICTTLKRENSNTEMDGVTLADHISLVTYLVFSSTNTGINANRHQWFICTALKREKSKNPWLKRIGAILNKSTTTRPTKYPVTRSTDFLV